MNLEYTEYLSDEELSKIAPMLERLNMLEKQKVSQELYMDFVKRIWPSFIEGRHHKIYADKLQQVADGKIKRLIVNMPPRHTKSEFASYLFPSWLMGKRPDLKIIQATHTAELAVGFGRKVKNLIDSDDFRDVFPDVKLAADAKASGRWSTNKGGEYYAVGVGGALAGRGADLLIIDDPVSEQDALSPTALDSIYEWYTSGPRQRLQPGGSIIIVMTRWGIKDLTETSSRGCRQMGSGRVSGNISRDWKRTLARILEQRRARRCESLNTRRQMERTVYAKSDCRRGSNNKKGVVEYLES